MSIRLFFVSAILLLCFFFVVRRNDKLPDSFAPARNESVQVKRVALRVSSVSPPRRPFTNDIKADSPAGQTALQDNVLKLLDDISSADGACNRARLRLSLRSSLSGLNESNLPAILKTAEGAGLFDGTRDVDALIFMDAWAGFDPTNAVAFALQGKYGDFGERLAENILVALPAAKNMGLFGALNEAGRCFVASCWVSQTGRKNWAEAVALWNEIADDSARRSASFALAQAWSESNPRAAADWLVSLNDDSNYDPFTVSQIMERWVRYKPLDALEWSAQIDNPEFLAEAFLNWWKQSPADAIVGMKWLNDGNSKWDAVRCQLAVALARNDPLASESLVDQVVNRETKTQLAMKIYQRIESKP